MNVSRHEGNRVDVTVTYTPRDVVITSTPFGAAITLRGAAGIGDPGEPALPRAVVRVALPEGAIAVSASGVVGGSSTLSKEPVLIAPVQPPRAADRLKPSLMRTVLTNPRQTIPVPPVVLPDRERYRDLLVHPRPIARLLARGDAQAPVATVEVNPLALDDAGRLVLHETITISITYRVQDEVTRAQKWRDVTQGRFTSAAQARDHLNLLRNLVVNASDVVRVPPWLDEIALGDSEYVVITDRHRWDAQTITTIGDVDGDPVAEFTRLVAWKRCRGLSARVVTVSDIVSGRYGDHRTGARDLPEVIRNFVKHARRTWGTRWLLLGGDIDIVPTRIADGGFLAELTPGATNPPEPGHSHWTGSELRINTTGIACWWGADAENILIRPDTGLVVPYDATGAAPLGWHFTTDDTYAAVSSAPTEHVVARGSASQLDAMLRFLYRWNRIPTDFYYASLVGTGYGVAGKHDWDFRDNGIYGEHGVADTDDPDVITWQAHVSVGRAPIGSAVDAKVFVDKVLAYEQLPEAGPLPLGHVYEREMVVVGDNWGGRVGVWPSSMSAPDTNQYAHSAGTDHTFLHLTDDEIPITYTVFAQVADDDLRALPYDATVSSGGRGWHYCVSATDPTPSTVTIDLGLPGTRFRLPVPSGYIVVYSPQPEELTPVLYILDEPAPDGSMMDQEQVADIARASLRGITSIARLYTDEVDLPAGRPPGAVHLTRATLTEALNRGPHLVALSGHGSPDGLCYLDGGLASSLTNGLPGFIGYADSCLTADYEWSDAMSEQLLTNPDGGGLAYVGNTRFSWIGVGDDFQRLFWQRLSTTQHLGLLADSRCELVHTAGLHPTNTKWQVLSLNLLGDPEMPVWTRPPKRLRLPQTIPVIKEWEWPIRDEFSRLVPGAIVTLTVRGRTLQGRADGGGVVRIDTTQFGHFAEAQLTITAPGHRPETGTIRTPAAQAGPMSLLATPAPRDPDDEPTSLLSVPDPGIDPANLTRDFRFG
jgi:hypothetical protein